MNTIILRKGYEILTDKEHEGFEKGDTIWGENAYSEELQRWDASGADEAREALGNLHSTYEHDGGRWYITEYALEFCTTDEDGEFLEGSDYDLA